MKKFNNTDLNEIALTRYKIIEPYLFKNNTKKDIEKLAKDNGIGIATAYRWIKNYRNSKKIHTLKPNFQNCGNGIRVNKIVEGIIQKNISSYTVDNKVVLSSLYNNIKKECTNKNLKSPHKNTIRNRLKKMNIKLVPLINENLEQNIQNFLRGNKPIKKKEYISFVSNNKNTIQSEKLQEVNAEELLNKYFEKI